MPTSTGPVIDLGNPVCRGLDMRRRELRTERKRWFDRLRDTRDPDERDNILHTVEGLDDRLQMLEEQLHDEGCYRSPVPAGMLLKIDGAELTQSIQYFAQLGSGAGVDNSLPLVAFKPLLVRTYVRLLQADVAQVDGRLLLMEFNPNTLRYDRLRRDLAPEATVTIAGESASSRRELRESLNFILPAEECHGKLRLLISAWVPDHGNDVVWRSLEHSEDIEFNTRRTPIVHCFRVAVTRRVPGAPTPVLLAAPTEVQCRSTIELAARMLPLPGIEYRDRGERAFSGPLEVQPDYDAIRADILTVRNTATPTPAEHEVYVAMIAWHDNAAHTIWGNALNGSIESIAADQGMFAHELAHLLLPGDDHVLDPTCFLAASMTGIDPNYPDYSSAIQRAGIGEFAVDVQASPRRLFTPEVPELMSYCGGDRWISPYNYARAFQGPMLDPFRPRSAVPAPATPIDNAASDGDAERMSATPQKLIVALRLYRDGQADLQWALHLPGAVPRHPPKGLTGHTLELHDASGALLATMVCQRSLHHLPTSPWDDVQVVLAWFDTAATLVLVGPTGEAARWPVEAARPASQRGTLRLAHAASAHSEAEGGDMLRVQVEGPADAADRPVFQMLRYSPDQGRTWVPLAHSRGVEPLVIDARQLGGNGALGGIELVLSSGFRTERLPVDGAGVMPRRGLGLRILSPVEGQALPRAEALSLVASFDAPGHGLAWAGDAWWSSQRDGFLGAGLALTLPASRLSTGRHVLRIVLRDASGGEVQASVGIDVRDGA